MDDGRDNQIVQKFYDAMRAAAQDEAGLTGRRYGIAGHWIWISRSDPNDSDILALAVLAEDPIDFPSNVFDVIVLFTFDSYEIYRPYVVSGGTLKYKREMIGNVFSEEGFVRSLYYPLLTTDHRREHPRT